LPSDEELRYYRTAGRIASEVRRAAREIVKEGMPMLEVCEKVEGLIVERGARPAFPCNVCVNEVAAHYTSPPRDETVIPRRSVVKVDIGVHVDGYIADTATTVCFSPDHEDMVGTTEEALRRAIATVRHGVSVSRIGEAVESTVKQRGFKPIWNLSGHQIARYVIHTGKSIPNVARMDEAKVTSGDVLALEPFVTLRTGKGEVATADEAYIFRFQKERSVKDVRARKLLEFVKPQYRTLPFAERWLWKSLSAEDYQQAFFQLLDSKSLMAYSVLVEASKCVVAQAEHTVLVKDDGCEILTG
jgi:methionyl aminopeptidase